MQMFGVSRGWVLWVWWASDLSSSLILLWNDCYQLSHVFHVLREMHPINFDDLTILSTGANLKLTAWFFSGEIFFVIRQNNPPSRVFMVLAGWLTWTLSQILTQNGCLKKIILSPNLPSHYCTAVPALCGAPPFSPGTQRDLLHCVCKAVFSKEKKVLISETQNRFLHIPPSITVLRISAQKKSRRIRDVLVTCYIMQN